MAKLKAATRNALPAAKFAGPGRSYPVNDRSHAVAAKGRATQMAKIGKLSPAAATRIRAKANAILGSA